VLLRVDADSLQEVDGRLLQEADLRGANLRGMDLSHLHLGYDLTSAELTRANLMGSVLARATLTDTDLMGARFDHRTEWPEGFEPLMRGAVRVEWWPESRSLARRHSAFRDTANSNVTRVLGSLRNGLDVESAALPLRISRSHRTPAEAALSLTYQGLLLLIEGRVEEATLHFREAIQVYPHLAAPHGALAYALLAVGQIDLAFVEYRHAIRIDSSESGFPPAWELYLPLLRAFELAGKATELITAYLGSATHEGAAGPWAGRPANPVEAFLMRQPEPRKRSAFLEVVSELIGREPCAPSYGDGWERIPNLVSVWEFLSVPSSELELRLEVYRGSLMDGGFSRRTIRRRLDIAFAFVRMCYQLGYLRSEESDGDLPRWLPSANW
jgi:tetratricopeptide (TPR) repeat protein